MDKEWVNLMKQAKQQGLSTTEVRDQLSNQHAGTKFIYETNDAEKVVSRVLEVSDIDDLTVISIAVSSLRQHYISKGWDKDKEIEELYYNIVKVDDILNGTIRPDPEYRKIGGS